MEETTHSLARQLLLLALFTDCTLQPRERLETFLDVHHNALIQQRTAVHAARLIQQLTQQLNTEAATHRYTQPACRPYTVDFSNLKRRELDATMQQLAFIASSAAHSSAAFDVSALFDARWRHYYGERYDSRQNLIDSDYLFRLKLVAPVYHMVHYRRWRVTGQAYEKRECTYDVSNRSLASVREAKAKGRGAVEVRGYWGDVVLGPSVVYGVDSDSEASYETRQNQHVNTAVDISEQNVSALMAAAGECVADGEAPRVTFHFLQGSVTSLAGRSRYRRLFHRVFLSHFQYAQLPSLPSLLSTEAKSVALTMDTLYYWPLRDEEKQAAQEKLREKVKQSGGEAGRWEEREMRNEAKRVAVGGWERENHGHKFLSFVWNTGASPSVPVVEERKEQSNVT